MPTQTANLFLLQDLDDANKTRELADSDLNALRTIADWVRTYVAMPNKDLGRTGPVCPFVGGSQEHQTLWLAAEHVGSRGVPDVVQLVNDYKRLLLRAQPAAGDDAIYMAIVVVFPDLSADRAKEVLDDVHIESLKMPFYMNDGVVLGQFHERNDGTAIYNASFHPFRAPVPFLLMRLAVPSDWKFFIDNEDWLRVWARRFGESAVETLAAELRRTNWHSVQS